MNKFTKLLILLCASTFFHSCTPLRTIINNEFPPLSTTDQQYISVERNLAGLADFNPHVGLNIDKDIIIQYLPVEIKKAAEAINDENVKVQNIEPKLSFDRQGVFVDADFLITIPKYDVEIKGSFIGVTAISTENDTLYLRSALSSLKIKSIIFTKKPKLSKKALANLISSILKNYIENINGQIFKKPTTIYTGWGETYKLSLKEMFKDPNTEVIADSIKISRFIKQTSIRVKSTGVSVMAELIKDKPSIDESSIPSPKTRTDAELTNIFKQFNAKYDSTWLIAFEPFDAKSLIVTNISKSEISNIFNVALSKQIILKQKFIVPEETFNKKLEVKRGDIDCQKVRTDFKYPDFNGDKCDWNCMKRVCVLGVCKDIEDPVCAASRRACKIKREAERVVWQTARETARVAHQVENETKVAACNVWRETMDFLALGRFKGNVSGIGIASINFKTFSFNNDLSEIILKYSGGVDAKLKSNLELNPVDLGNVFFCFSNYDKKISSNMDINIPDATSKVAINSSRVGENLILNIKLDKVSYNASINPSPLHSLLLDPQFRLQCPISTLLDFGSISVAAGKFLGMVKLAPEQELLLLGQVKGSYGIDAIQIPFKPIDFKINGEPKKSLIFWNNKSIQFTYLKP
jgi:hypothetical protein